MSLKKNIKKILKNPEQRIDIYYLSTKIVFSFQAFLFFLGYFFVAAWFYDEYLYPVLLPLYISFVLSFALFLSAFGIRLCHNRAPGFISILCVVAAACIAGAFLIPVL